MSRTRSATEDTPRRRHRGLRWLGIAVFVLLVVLLTPISVVLFTQWGTSTALERFVSWYDDRVPAHLEVGEIEGTLGRGLTIRDLRIEDSEGHPLIEAQRARLDLTARDLVTGEVTLDELIVEGLRVHVWPPDEPGFSDLSRPDAPPKPPGEPPGPDLPIDVVIGDLQIDDFALVRHGAERDETLVAGAHMRGALRATGTEARLHLDALWGEVPPADVAVAAASGRIDWDAPKVRVHRFEAVTSAGHLHRLGGFLEVTDRRFGVDTMASVLPSGLGQDLPWFDVELQAGGSPRGAWALLGLTRPGDASTRLSALGALEPRPAVVGVGTAWARLEAWLEDAEPVELGYLLAAQGDLQRGGASMALACASCEEPLALTARADIDQGQLQVRVEPAVPGAEITARARADEQGWQQLAVQAEIARAARVRDALSPFVELPPVAGSLKLTATCQPRETGPSCEGKVTGQDVTFEDDRIGALSAAFELVLRDGAPRFELKAEARDVRAADIDLDRARISVSGTPEALDVDLFGREGKDELEARARVAMKDGQTRVDVDELRASIPGLDLELERPASVRLSEQGIELDDVRLRVGEGRVAATGRLDLEGRSDITARARNVELGPLLDRLAPDLDLTGELDALARIEGPASRPRIDLDLDVRGLGMDGRRVGDVTARVRQADEQIMLNTDVSRGPVQIDLEAALPVAVDLRSRQLELDAREPIAISLDLGGVPLTSLADLDLPWALRGGAQGKIMLSGTLAEPVLVGVLDVFHLRVEDVGIGNLRLELVYRDRLARVRLEGRGDIAKRLNLALTVPVRWSVEPFDVGLREDGDYEVAVLLDSVELDDLSDVVPGLPELDGVVDLDLSAAIARGRLVGSVRVLAASVSLREQELGSFEVLAELDPQWLQARWQASGPDLRLVEGRAKVPVWVSVPELQVHWERERHHSIYTELRHVRLAALTRWLQLPPASGELDGMIALRGREQSFVAGIDLDARRLSYGAREFGHAQFAASWDGNALDAFVLQERGAQSLFASAEVPLELDPSVPEVRWLEDEPHRFDLLAKGIDRALLEPFVPLPTTWNFDGSAWAVLEGPATDPRLMARIRSRFRGKDSMATTVHLDLRGLDDRYQAEASIGARGPRQLRAFAEVEAPLVAMVRGEYDVDEAVLAARLEAEDFPLHDLDPLLPSTLHETQGSLTMTAAASGALTAPELSGAINLEQGAVTVVPLNQRFDGIELLARMEGSRIRLDALRFESGAGEGRGEGWVQLARGETRGELNLVADELPVVKPGLPLMKVDTRIDVDVDATGAITRVDVVIDDTAVAVLDTDIDAVKKIPSHPGVEFVDAIGRREQEIARRRQQQVERPKEPWIPREMRVAVTIGDPVLIQGNDIDMAWDGQVIVTRRPGQPPEARGQIEVERGRVALLGEAFQIEEGRVFLPPTGDLDPYISLTAVAEMPDASVTMQVRGRASRPDLVLSSDPPMAQTDIFALLVTGRADSSEQADESFGAKAASLLAAFNNPALQRELQDRIGLDRVGVGFGETVEQPIVSLGKRFGRNVYVETSYHVNAPRDENEAEVRLEYVFPWPSWSLETYFGDAAEGGIAIWWRKRFGMPFYEDKPKEAAHRSPGRPSAAAVPGSSGSGPTRDLARSKGSP